MQAAFDYPKIKLEIPANAEREGLLPTPHGMPSWKNPGNEFVVIGCGYYADPDKRSEEAWKRITLNLREDQIEREVLINFNSRGGEKIFPYLEGRAKEFLVPSLFVNGKWDIPKDWDIIAGLDYGARNPTSIHFYGIDQEKRFTSFWEFYQPSHYLEISEVLKAHPLWDRVDKVVVDPSIFKNDQNRDKYVEGKPEVTSIGDLLIEEGIYNIEKGNNGRVAGLERVKEMFNQRSGDPRPSNFFISVDCEHQWDEFLGLRYKVESQAQLMNKTPSEDAQKKDDHAFDETKYAMLSVDTPAVRVYKKSMPEFGAEAAELEFQERDAREESNEDYY